MGEGDAGVVSSAAGATLDSITVNGVQLRSYLWGRREGAPLIFVHGHMDSGLSFDYAARRLQDRYFCIAPDLRGYGASAHAVNPLGYFMVEHIADLFALAQHYAPGKPVRMVGHSMGGNLALIFAGTFPGLVSHLASIEAYGFIERHADAVPGRLSRWVLETQRSPTNLPRYRSEAAYFRRQAKRYPRIDPALDRIRHQHMLRVGPSEQVHLSADPKHQWPAPISPTLAEVAAFLRRITAKCLLVLGEDSELKRWIEGDAANSQLEARIKLFPTQTRVVSLPDCGHNLHLEKPGELADLLQEFLQQ